MAREERSSLGYYHSSASLTCDLSATTITAGNMPGEALRIKRYSRQYCSLPVPVPVPVPVVVAGLTGTGGTAKRVKRADESVNRRLPNCRSYFVSEFVVR